MESNKICQIGYPARSFPEWFNAKRKRGVSKGPPWALPWASPKMTLSNFTPAYLDPPGYPGGGTIIDDTRKPQSPFVFELFVTLIVPTMRINWTLPFHLGALYLRTCFVGFAPAYPMRQHTGFTPCRLLNRDTKCFPNQEAS